jgi:DNA polymerase III subunit beta
MKVEIDVNTLIAELEQAAGIAGKNTVIPILSHVLLRAEGEHATLSATDAHNALVSKFPARVAAPGAALLPIAELTRVAKALSGSVTIAEASERWFTFEAGSARLKLPGMALEDFPSFPTTGAVTLIAARGRFAEMVRRVLFVQRRNDGKHGSWDGLLVKLADGELTVASTNGASAALCKSKIDQKGAVSMFVPVMPATLLQKLLEAGGDDTVIAGVQARGSAGGLFFTVGARTLFAASEERTWPAGVEKAMQPLADSGTFEVDADDLEAAVRTAAIVATNGTVKFSLSKGSLVVAAAGDKGEGRRSAEVDYDGKDREAGVNSAFVLDYLAASRLDRVHVSLYDTQTGIHMRPPQDGEYVYRYTFMPLWK